MRLLEEREILFWEYFEKLCDIIGVFLFFFVIFMISYVYYKGVEYCYLIGIFFKIIYIYKLLKKILLGGGGGGLLRRDFFFFNYRVFLYID